MRTEPVSVRDAFNLLDVAPEFLTSGFPAGDITYIPKRIDEYVFRRETLRDILAFLDNPDGDGLFFSGHYGAGKTSLPYQVACRLNWPVMAFTAHERMEFDDLVGTWKLVNGTMDFVHGPLSIAMRDGYIFVLNECDRADPGQLSGLHDILEGHPLVIASNGGEVINAHENFRFVATGNSVGSGDQSGLYQGVNTLDIAFMDRFRVVEVQYPEPEVELSILEKKAPSLPESIRRDMVRTAGEIRKLFIGGAEGATPLTITMSTRALLRWARLTETFKNAPNAIHYSLTQSLTAKAEPEQRLAIEEIARSIFGETWTEASDGS